MTFSKSRSAVLWSLVGEAILELQFDLELNIEMVQADGNCEFRDFMRVKPGWMWDWDCLWVRLLM